MTHDPYGNQPYDPYAGQQPQEYSLDPSYNAQQSSPPGGYPSYGDASYGPQDAQQYTAVPYAGQSYTAPPYGEQMPQNGLGVTALVLGICTIALSWCCYGLILGGPTGVLAIVFGSIGLQKANRGEANNRGVAMAGLVCGIAGLAIGVIMLILLLALGLSLDTYPT